MGSSASKNRKTRKYQGKSDCMKSVELEQQQRLLPQKDRFTSEANLNCVQIRNHLVAKSFLRINP